MGLSEVGQSKGWGVDWAGIGWKEQTPEALEEKVCTPEKGQGQSRTIWKHLKTHPTAALTQH